MNDFERQLSSQPLRQPPPEWRAGILSAEAKVMAHAWTWRDWFWPSPVAWGALAAVWVAAFVLGGSGERSVASRADHFSAAPPAAAPLYAFSPHRDLSLLLDPLN
jgi:hypothetical protein